MKVTLSSLFRSSGYAYLHHRTLHRNPLFKNLQLPLGNGELGEAAIQTDQKLWKDPHYGFVQTREAGEMNDNFPVESALILRLARLASHCSYLSKGQQDGCVPGDDGRIVMCGEPQ